MMKLTDETWGERLQRARRRTGIGTRELAAHLRQVEKVSYATLCRVERLDERPTKHPERRRAYLMLLALDYDPADFGLSDADLPAYYDIDKVKALLSAAKSRCFSRVPHHARRRIRSILPIFSTQ